MVHTLPHCRVMISKKGDGPTMSYALIRRAVLEKKTVRAVYQGLYCEMCPHLIGTRNGRECALCYQFGGQSSSRLIQPDGSIENWRCVEIAELFDVTIEDGAWHTARFDSSLRSCIEYLDAIVPC